ncbi:MAG: hypothetical protein ACI8UO_004711, partial [Verrucomicrobiales bacterium]
VAAITVFSAAAHALGASTQLELSHATITPPFHFMVLTPEAKPLWLDVAMRYLARDLERSLTERLTQECVKTKSTRSDKTTAEGAEEEKQLLALTAALEQARRVAVQVVSEQITPPLASSPLDGHLTLLTPPQGLGSALSKLSPEQLVRLEETLRRVVKPDPNSKTGSTAPSLFWQLPTKQAGAFFRHHRWLRSLPFLLLECPETGFPMLDGESNVKTTIARMCEQFFDERLRHAAKPRSIRPRTKDLKPVMQFLEEGQRWEATESLPIPALWMAELAVKFTLIMARMGDDESPQLVLYEQGLEMAKYFIRKHLQNLSAHFRPSPADRAEITELSKRDRQVYLKICEKGPTSKAKLRRSMNGVLADELNDAVVCLLSRGLIVNDGNQLRQNAV